MRRLLGWLVAAELADAVDGDGLLPEDRDPDRRFWDFHDALHFRRSRSGGHDHPVGASFPGRGVVAPLPAVKPPIAHDPADLITLPMPDIAALCRGDPPFQAVVEARRSHRVRGEQPITLDRLGAFLARTARIITLIPPDPGRDLHYEASIRPYPCGGAAYETEIYLAVDACEGLARGLYHYDPLHHRLERVGDDGDLIDSLVTVAWQSAAQTVRPQIVIHLAARMRRLMWKYRGLAWSVALKHAGVLYHAFYLAATVEGLAPCGLGAGDTELVARAYGLDPVAESPIGEFMLSSLPRDAEGSPG
ncbi:MAG: SagB/ThcOx family dehydrogenase [Caldilineae bacterium]|nr:MAG: SagB/ThcOx family dehydrogenase [Caldilineae bacterium]